MSCKEFCWRARGDLGMNPLTNCQDRDSLEREARYLHQAAPLGNGMVLCRVLGKYILYADAQDVGITPHLCLDGFWESWITLAVMRLVQPGWHCVDVGANCGYYTLLLADLVGKTGRVLAVEPNPAVVQLLERSVEVNGFQNITEIAQRAAADRTGKRVSLFIPRERSMDASLVPAPRASDVPVQTVAVDEVTANWSRVDFIKIDAEGAEESIWQGMRKTLERHPDICIVMELRCERYANPGAFLGVIRQAGFRFRYIDYDGSVQETEEEHILCRRSSEDWILFLRR